MNFLKLADKGEGNGGTYMFTVVIIFQALMFSVGMQFNKKLINISAITVYTGMIIFFFVVFFLGCYEVLQQLLIFLY